MTVKTLGKKLAESIVGVLGSSVYTVNNLGNSFLRIILILNSSSVGEKYSAYKLSSRGDSNFILGTLYQFLANMSIKTPHLILKCGEK